MADIKINDIEPAGAELFADSEDLLNELNDDELSNILGGLEAARGFALSSLLSIACHCNHDVQAVSEV
ncbi:bacteriocin [Komarekiella sp. 'clone 1']|uniref:Bacteriocin n=1 Tax=Komarekiella delphini-convector SJRDD-AB1 TaxID=2593771 RepID=A0AA40VUA6_9NOST|nr:bacteriocin [Komarekiella delphini-convector]MBD6619516.1 bacteriocin [Komarekiella delphini-convector SJRDD-AB1]